MVAQEQHSQRRLNAVRMVGHRITRAVSTPQSFATTQQANEGPTTYGRQVQRTHAIAGIGDNTSRRSDSLASMLPSRETRL